MDFRTLDNITVYVQFILPFNSLTTVCKSSYNLTALGFKTNLDTWDFFLITYIKRKNKNGNNILYTKINVSIFLY